LQDELHIKHRFKVKVRNFNAAMPSHTEAVGICGEEEEDRHLEEGTEDSGGTSDEQGGRNRQFRFKVLKSVLAPTLCLLFGFLGGRITSPTSPGTNGMIQVPDSTKAAGASTKATLDYLSQHYTVPCDSLEALQVSAQGLPSIDSLPLQLQNNTRTGDGWAPWQFAISGPSEYNEAGQAWVIMDGVGAIVIDPDATELQDELHIKHRFKVKVRNFMHEPALIHWHGFVPPNNLDGIPWISSMPIQPNASQFYDFIVYHRGFNWAHSHFGHQLEAGLLAPIIIKDHPAVRASLGDPTEVLMLIFDGHWRTECAYQFHLYPHHCPIGGFDSWNDYQFSVNGHDLRKGGAREVVVPAGKPVRLKILHAGAQALYRVSLGGLQGEIIATDGMHVQRGFCVDEFPIANAERIDVLVNIPASGGRFDIIAQRIGHDTPVSNAERGVLVLKTNDAPNRPLPDPYFNGSAPPFDQSEFNNFNARLQATHGIADPHRAPDVHHVVRLTGDYDKVTGEWRPGFSINDKEVRVWPAPVWCKLKPGQGNWDLDDTVVDMAFCQSEAIVSNLKCDAYACARHQTGDADGRCLPEDVTVNAWKGIHVNWCDLWVPQPNTYRYNPDSLEVCHGDRVWITYASETMKEGHSMHLHGTHQQLIAVNGAPVTGALKDTWFVPKGMNITIAFDAYNPGEWLLHCHIGHHVNEGMATTLRYITNDPRCKKGQFSKWTNGGTLPVSEWPSAWDALWEKRDPNAVAPEYKYDIDR